MSCDPPLWSQRLFTAPRWAPYLQAADRAGTHAEHLYRWNLQVSEAFYPGLHVLEITLRNTIHAALRAHFGRADWWTVAPLDTHDVSRVRQAATDLRCHNGGRSPRPDDVVAGLSFGFSVSLLSRRYDRHFWVPALHTAFPRYHGSRDRLHDNMDAMRRLRNRIMHHEPIHHRHLQADHEKINRLLGYIDPDIVTWLKRFDRVPAVLTERPRRDEGG